MQFKHFALAVSLLTAATNGAPALAPVKALESRSVEPVSTHVRLAKDQVYRNNGGSPRLEKDQVYRNNGGSPRLQKDQVYRNNGGQGPP